MFRATRNQGLHAFSLLDLIALIATLAFIGLLFAPALARTRVNDRVFQCVNNMRQLTAAWQMYADDHEGALTSTWTWVNGALDYSTGHRDNTNVSLLLTSQLGPYIQNPEVYKCPADRSMASFTSMAYPRVRSVSMNEMFRSDGSSGWARSPPWTIFKRSSDIVAPIPSTLWVMIDENPDSINDGSFSVNMDGSIWQASPSTLHNGGCTFSFADGRAEMKQWTDRRSVNGRMATTYTSVFAYGQYQPNNLDIQWLQERTTARQ